MELSLAAEAAAEPDSFQEEPEQPATIMGVREGLEARLGLALLPPEMAAAAAAHSMDKVEEPAETAEAAAAEATQVAARVDMAEAEQALAGSLGKRTRRALAESEEEAEEAILTGRLISEALAEVMAAQEAAAVLLWEALFLPEGGCN
jgi:hypothetical protein